MAGKETFEFGEERNVDAINEKAFKSRYMDPKLKKQEGRSDVELIKGNPLNSLKGLKGPMQPVLTQNSVETPSTRIEEIARQLKDLEKELTETLEREKSVEYSDKESDGKNLEEVKRLSQETMEMRKNPEYAHLFTNKYTSSLVTSPDEKALLDSEYQKSVKDNLQINLKKVEQFSAQKEAEASGSSGPEVKIDLYTNKEIQTLKTNLKILELERRVHSIQNYLGDSAKIASFLKGNETLEDKLPEISRVVEFIKEDEPKYMYHKVNLLKTELDKIQTRSITEDAPPKIKAEDLVKISEIHETLKEMGNYSELLPMLVDRLGSMRMVHEEAAQLSMRLKDLEDLSKNILGRVHTDSSVLGDLKKGLKENIETLNDNISILQKK